MPLLLSWSCLSHNLFSTRPDTAEACCQQGMDQWVCACMSGGTGELIRQTSPSHSNVEALVKPLMAPFHRCRNQPTKQVGELAHDFKVNKEQSQDSHLGLWVLKPRPWLTATSPVSGRLDKTELIKGPWDPLSRSLCLGQGLKIIASIF